MLHTQLTVSTSCRHLNFDLNLVPSFLPMPTFRPIVTSEASETSAWYDTREKKTPKDDLSVATKSKTPDSDNLHQKSIHAFFPKSSDSKENVEINVEGEPPKKKTKYQCDYCHDAVFDDRSECVKHEETCDARKPSANKSSDPKKKEEEATKKKKRRRKSKIPSEPKGNLAVNVLFKDDTESLTIDGVYTDVFGDDAVTLTGEYPSHSKRAIKNFLRGFGRFVW